MHPAVRRISSQRSTLSVEVAVKHGPHGRSFDALQQLHRGQEMKVVWPAFSKYFDPGDPDCRNGMRMWRVLSSGAMIPVCVSVLVSLNKNSARGAPEDLPLSAMHQLAI